MTYAATSDYSFANTFHPSSRGISSAAKYIGQKIRQIAQNQLSTGHVQVSFVRTLELLNQVVEDCREHNWGGEGELPIDTAAKTNAEKFLSLLPNKYQLAEVIPEPHGAVALEWNYGPFKSMIVSFTKEAKIEYSVLSSRTSASSGHCLFYGAIPLNLVRHLNELSVA